MKLRYLLLASVLVAVATGLTLFLVTTMNAPVARISIDGPLSTSEQTAVEDVVAPLFPARMLGVELDALMDSVHSLDWVESVHVRRQWPDTLVLQISKPTLVARWSDGGFVSATGRLVSMPDSTVLGELPVLGARHAEPERAIELFELFSNRLADAGLSLIALTESGSGEWTVRLSGDIEVRLGRANLVERLERVIGLCTTELARWMSLVQAVDARYHNGVAVSWREGSPLLAMPSNPGSGAME